ncbi:MAG: hypothetical protein V4573_17800 [Pseudomonadota bacterium]
MGAKKDTIITMASRPQGVTNGETAKALAISSEDAGGSLASGVQCGWLFKSRRPGENTHYFTTNTAAKSWLDDPYRSNTVMDKVTHGVLAQAAIKKFKAGDIRSSYELADTCNCSAQVMDQALAPLVEAGKLLRVPTQRSGIDMFTYRYSACWVPKPEDFNFAATGQQPKASVSPVAPSKKKDLPPAPAPAARSPVAVSRPAAPTPQPRQVQAQPTAPVLPGNLGFTFAAAPSTSSDPDAALLAAMVDSPDAPVIEAADLAFAINSLGEFVIDLGQGDLVMFTPEKALQLKRFLGNTTILESLEGAA